MRAKVENICINDMHVDTERERETHKDCKDVSSKWTMPTGKKKNNPHEKPKQPWADDRSQHNEPHGNN